MGLAFCWLSVTCSQLVSWRRRAVLFKQGEHSVLQRKALPGWQVNQSQYTSPPASAVGLCSLLFPTAELNIPQTFGNIGKNNVFSLLVWTDSPFQCKESLGHQEITMDYRYLGAGQKFFCLFMFPIAPYFHSDIYIRIYVCIYNIYRVGAPSLLSCLHGGQRLLLISAVPKTPAKGHEPRRCRCVIPKHAFFFLQRL